jgi:hypothetical protein
MSITTVSTSEFYFTMGRLIEGVDTFLPQSKKIAETASPSFGCLVERIESLQNSIKNSFEVHHFSNEICIEVAPDVLKLIDLCEGLRLLVLKAGQNPLTTDIVNQTIEKLLSSSSP